MKQTNRFILSIILTAFILIPLFNISGAFAAESKTMTILFTHDMHDHILPVKDMQNGELYYSGGFARLKSVVSEEKQADPGALMLDAGDFSMGTPFQTLFTTDAPQLRLMGELGYDAVTFGNHEYDYRASGLAASLRAAKKSGDRLPFIVQSNVVFPDADAVKELKQAYEGYGVKDYVILERNGVKTGIFGLMGKDSAKDAPMSGVAFSDQVESAKRIVKILKEQEGAELVICLSHCGTWENKSKSEDEILAKEVPEIDVIISGHTHTMLSAPIIAGNTIIGSADDSLRYLGIMNISQDPAGRWKLDSYRLQHINGNLPDDPDILKTIHQYESLLQQKYFDRFNMNFTDVLAVSPYNFNAVSYMSDHLQEDPLGNLISDAYIYAIKNAEGENHIPIDAAIVPVGTIRGAFYSGDITVSDAFNVSSLGIGPDKVPGYPLISIYLTGSELKTVCEVDASISPIMNDAQLYISGISYTFNPNRLIFNKVVDVRLQRQDGSYESIDDKKLYRIAAGLYSAQMLSVVGEKSFGLLSIVPKTKEGIPVTDYEAHIVKDTTGGSNSEVKEWFAIARYLESFEKVDGVSQVPKYYSQTHSRKVIFDSHNIYEILKSPNKISLAVYVIIIFIVILAAFIIHRIATRKKRRLRRGRTGRIDLRRKNSI